MNSITGHILIVISLFFVTTTVFPDEFDNNKIDPLLTYIIDSFDTEGTRLDDADFYLAGVTPFVYDSREVPKLPVFIQTLTPAASVHEIEIYGGSVILVTNTIIVAQIPLDAIGRIAGTGGVEYIEPAIHLTSRMNVSREEIKAHYIHSGHNLPQAYTGQDVIVGIVDTGIDWKHEDFKDSDGFTRIKYLWDMSGTENPPTNFNFGREYTSDDINLDNCDQIDGDNGYGHGTHVAGIAAGSGIANAAYTGIAPASNIVFVKGLRDHNSGGGFNSADIIAGCTYIFEKADSLGQPAVINLSLGGHYGPHDGTSLFEQALSDLTGEGKIIVSSAGNDGFENIHAGYPTDGTNFSTGYQTFLDIPPGVDLALIDVWYDTGNIHFGIAGYDTSGALLGILPSVAPGQKLYNVPFTVGGTTRLGHITVDAETVSYPGNNAKRVVIIIDGKDGQYDISTDRVIWSVYTYGSGTFDAWFVTGGTFNTLSDSENRILGGDTRKTVGMPATAEKVIGVGSYVSQNQWMDADGNTWDVFQWDSSGSRLSIAGERSFFSSIGPARDERIKPEIMAPGDIIGAALSGDLSMGVGIDGRFILEGGKHRVMRGTSMAAPHVAGTIALLLEKNPRLTYDDIVDVLTVTAKHDHFTGQVPNDHWGYGKLDAYAAMQAIPSSVYEQVTSPLDYRLFQNYPNPFNPITTIKFSLPEGSPVTIIIFDVLGRKVEKLVDAVYEKGLHTLEFHGTDLASGIYFYRIQTNTYIQTKKMTLTK